MIRLYAVIPAGEVSAVRARRGVSHLTAGRVAALFGPPLKRVDPTRAALWHDRVVGSALTSCSAIVPFRLGTDFASVTELRKVLRLNSRQLAEQLARFRGRVEMGLKVRLLPPLSGPQLWLPSGLDRVRALAQEPADRCERLRDGNIFEGCYLISRQAIDDFWRAVEAMRCHAPEQPVLGSGPWAPYSFCPSPLQTTPAGSSHPTPPGRGFHLTEI
jgi:hypothetical protein